MIKYRVKQKMKVMTIHSLLLTKEFLETKPGLKAVAVKLLNYLPYVGPRLQRFGKNIGPRYEAYNEKDLSLQSRTIYHELINALTDKRRQR
jgi:hypothetical protein